MSVDHALEDLSDIAIGLDVVELGGLDCPPSAFNRQVGVVK
jgi:hypothetical protein